MQEVVLPALDPQNAIAQEQGKLVLGSLNLLLGQVDYAHTFEVLEARALSTLLAETVSMAHAHTLAAGAVTALQILLKRAHSLIENAATPVHVLQQLNHDLREALTRLIEEIESNGTRELARAIAVRVLDFSTTHLARERSWVAATGFEASGSVADIPTALAAGTLT